MIITRKSKSTHFLITFVLVISMLFPTGGIVRAEEVPTPEPTEETIVDSTQGTENTQAPIVEESAVESTGSVTTDPVQAEVITVTEESLTQETVTDEPVIEGTVTSDSVETTMEGTSDPVLEGTPISTLAEPTLVESVTQENVIPDTGGENLPVVESSQTLSDEIQALADIDASLVDVNNEPIPLASNLARDVLTNADPYFTRGGVTYHYYPTGESCGVGETLGVDCFVSNTPIQDAINGYSAITPLPGEENTIYVLPGTYQENITISVADLTLMGNPGDETVAGAAVDAPVIEGTGGTGITITADGVTVTGFIIQGFDTGILVSVVSGNNDISILNNTITDNGTGVMVEKYTGSPGTEIHYNSFNANDNYALANNNITGNVQYIQAQNNFWGCEIGPVVYGEETTGKPADRRTGYWQWPTAEFLGDTLPEGCQLLDGYESLWNHQIDTSDWSPFKINLDAVVTLTETVSPEPTTQTPEPTTQTPEPTTQTPEPTTQTPEPTTQTPEPTTQTPEPTTQTPEPTTQTPEPTTQTPEPTTQTPEPTTQTPEPTTQTPEPTTQTPEPTTETPVPTTETSVPTDPPVAPPPASPPVIPVTGPAFVIPVTGGQPIITAGLSHTCMTYDNSVYCWGLNASGQVGNGNNENQLTPVKVLNVNNVVDLTSGSEFSCALTAAGDIWCWGENSSGQLGDGTTENRNIPVMVKELPVAATGFTAGEDFACAELENGETWCWGNNEYGQLVDGTKISKAIPVRALFNQTQNLLSGGHQYLLGESAGDLAAWITGNSQLVNNVFFPQAISANRFVSGGCAVTFAGTVNCWSNGFDSSEVANISTAIEVDTGSAFACSVNEDLTVSCWGDNGSGQLGDGSNDNRSEGSLVTGIVDVQALAVGANHACVLVGDNHTPYCWGANTSGQLGNNSIENNSFPVRVLLPSS